MYFKDFKGCTHTRASSLSRFGFFLRIAQKKTETLQLPARTAEMTTQSEINVNTTNPGARWRTTGLPLSLSTNPPTHHFFWMCDDNRKHCDLCSRPVCAFLSCPLAPHSSIFSPPWFFTQEEAQEGTEEKFWHVVRCCFVGAGFFFSFVFIWYAGNRPVIASDWTIG